MIAALLYLAALIGGWFARKALWPKLNAKWPGLAAKL